MSDYVLNEKGGMSEQIKRWIVIAMTLIVLVIAIPIIYSLIPRDSGNLRSILAKQLSVNEEYLFINIMPRPSRYPGTLLLAGPDLLLEGTAADDPTLIKSPQFEFSSSFKGLVQSEGALDGIVGKMIVNSEADIRYELEITRGYSLEMDPLTPRLETSLLAPSIIRDTATKVNVVFRAWVGELSLLVQRKRSMAIETWGALTDSLNAAADTTAHIEFGASVGEEGRIRLTFVEPVVFAFEALDARRLLVLSQRTGAKPIEGEADARAVVRALVAVDPLEIQDLPQTLREMGPEAGQAVVEVMREGGPIAKERGQVILRELPPEARVKVDNPEVSLTDTDPSIRAWSVIQLSEAPSPDRVRLLSTALSDGDPTVRYLASEALGKTRVQITEVTAALSAATQDQDPAVRRAAEVSLLSVRAEHGRELQVVDDALNAGRPQTRVAGVRLIGAATMDPTASLQRLIRALHDPDQSVRLEALKTLPQLGLSARGAVSEIQPFLNATDPETRRLAQRALLLINRNPR
jgi:hypothetical protein